MTLKDIIKTRKAALEVLRATIAPQLAQRDAATETIRTINDTATTAARTISEDEAVRINAADEQRRAIDIATATQRAEIESAEALLADLERELAADEAANERTGQTRSTGTRGPAYDDIARVGREERTYDAHKSRSGQASFFRDAYAATKGNNPEAWERLNRNRDEMRVDGAVSERALTTASFGSLVVPQYLVDLAAPVARAGRPIANTVNHQQLPAEGMTLTIPRGTTGASAASQATQNTAVSETDETWNDLVIPVVTVAGQQKRSRQSLERGTSGMDELIYMDIAGAHAAEVDRQVAAGTGTSGQMLGIINSGGVTQMSAYGAAVTPTTYYQKVAGGVNAVETLRFMAPTVIYAAPRRWNWLVSSFDQQGRPLVVPRSAGPMNAIGVWDEHIDPPSSTPNGELQGLPVITDANLPLSIGTGPEDISIVARREDLLLWEDGSGAPTMLRFDEPLGNQLETVLVGYSYCAFTAERYPKAVALLGGNAGTLGFGQIAPTF